MNRMMKRTILLFALNYLILGSLAWSQNLKFAIISDIHHDIMHDADKRLTTFLDAARKNKVDFIIELGDFAFPKDDNQPFLNIWNSYPGVKYHVLGNHDHENSTKEAYMKFVGMERNYYSFDRGAFHFIVLDPNYLCKDGKYTSYQYGNFYVDEKLLNHIDPEQVKWLQADLAATNKRCIIFSHQCLENTVSNREQIRAILEAENQRAGRQKVIAAFSGHDHTNYERVINGISYIQINSASNQWVGDDFQAPGRFDEATNQRRPSLKYVVPYKDAVYAIVHLSKKNLKVKGIKSTFIPPTPKELKIPESRYPYPLVPWINDYSFDFR